jgi:sterol 3beta-glucosyltransferase
MRVLIVTVGSRGDVAPFTGLGTALQAAGHSVVIGGYEMFAAWSLAAGLSSGRFRVTRACWKPRGGSAGAPGR